MKNLSITVCTCACLLLPAAGMAAKFDMNPGKWEFTTTMTMPMLPQPRTTTSTECITEEEAKQDPLADLIDDDNCKILNKKIKGSSLEFEMECNEGGMTTRGKGLFTAQKNTASGTIEMIMEMPEMPNMPNMPSGPMTMKTSWQGKRIGACE